MKQNKSAELNWLLPIIVLALGSLFLSVGIGTTLISWSEISAALTNGFLGTEDLSDIKQRIIFELRLPRVIMAFTCGAGLAAAGAVLQTVTRNPLADPYLFGISSGSAFGAVIVIAAVGAGNTLISQYGITAGAFLGSLASVLLVLSLAGRGVQIERMLLAGVAISFTFSAGTSIILYASDPLAAAALLFWTLGSFTSADWSSVSLSLALVAACLVVFFFHNRALQAMLMGDENALGLGIDAAKLRIQMLLASSVLTAVLVANCGGIGFVGLMIPHIVRRLIKNERHLLWSSALCGGIFMVWVDVVARELLNGVEIPIGVITAAIGSVFFLVLLKTRKWSSS